METEGFTLNKFWNICVLLPAGQGNFFVSDYSVFHSC